MHRMACDTAAVLFLVYLLLLIDGARLSPEASSAGFIKPFVLAPL